MRLPSQYRTDRLAGFTLVEVVVAFALIGAIAGATYVTFTVLNTQSVSARLFTNATAIAQNQIELFQTDGPFNPQNGDIPAELAIGTQQSPGVIIYTDPDNNNVVVTGTITTEVADAGYTAGTPAINLNVRQLKVTLTYIYHSRNYTVIMDTMRTSDS